MSIYVEEMLAQIEKLDAFCERLQKRMQVDPVPSRKRKYPQRPLQAH